MIVCDGLVKIYKSADLEVVALQGLDLRVEPGELMAIVGNSGSGKSTLLNMLGGLDRPSAGKLTVAGKDLLSMSDRDLIRYKRETVGFVWQNNARNLIPYLTAQENVELPILLRGRRRKARALELLEAVGLQDRRRNRLSELSGGEQQR
ncbi:ABC transporter ATP-binding protein, partial [Paenibacillus cisolokensis]